MSRHIPKRVTLFCGHYGSGKTNLAVNYAFWMKAQGLPVSIADLDVVNPYFRTGDSAEDLKEAGIDIVTLPFANSNVDLPALPSEIYGLVQRHDKYAVLDVGGDDRGAYALGSVRALHTGGEQFRYVLRGEFLPSPDKNSRASL